MSSVRIIYYGMEKRVYPPFRATSARLLRGSINVNRQGFELDEQVKLKDRYSGLYSSQNTD